MKIEKVLKVALVAAVAMAGSASAALLMEVDFSGSGGISTIASSDGQVTTHANLNYQGADAMGAFGGGLSTGGWNYDGTGDAAANADLFTSSNFGSPTRMDVYLGFADAGYSYTITNVEIVVRASNTPANWDFMYRDTNNDNQIIAGGEIANQGGADPRTTYSIDLSSEGLTATDSTATWLFANDLRFAFYEADGTGPSDNLQIDAIRLNGTVIPEPGTLGMIAAMGGGILFIRRLMM